MGMKSRGVKQNQKWSMDMSFSAIFKKSGIGILITGFTLIAQSVRADVLVSNLAEPIRGSTPMGNNPNPVEPPENSIYWYWAAQSFRTDANTYTLDSIEVLAGEASSKPAPFVIAELYSDDGGAIGVFLGSFTAPDLSGPLASRTFTPDSPITLDPSTTYWLLLGCQAPGDGTFLWTYALSNEYVGPGSVGGFADSSDSGANWNYATDFPYFIQVNAHLSADTDGDGVDDVDDICCNTPPGTAIDAFGGPVGDLDHDCDNDLEDYLLYQRGFTGPLSGPSECP